MVGILEGEQCCLLLPMSFLYNWWIRKSDVVFTHNGFHDWKHALGKKGSIQKHDKCRSQMEAIVSWNAYIQMKSSNSSVADMMGSARAQHVAKNVHFMKTIAEVILLCSQQLRDRLKGT